MADRNITMEQVEAEHREEVNPTAHWAYVVGVLTLSLLLMLALIAWLGASST